MYNFYEYNNISRECLNYVNLELLNYKLNFVSYYHVYEKNLKNITYFNKLKI